MCGDGRRSQADSWVEQPSGHLLRRYYIADHLGSTRAFVNEQGVSVEARDHYPYGLMMPGRTFTAGQETREGYTGHELDAETGMYYAGARFYMPALARWTAVDALADKHFELSPYNYVANNPIALIDPDGKDFVITFGRDEDENINSINISATYFVQDGDEESYNAHSQALQGITDQTSNISTGGRFIQRFLGIAPKASVSFNLSIEYSSNPRSDARNTEGGNWFMGVMAPEAFATQYQEDGGDLDPTTVGGYATGYGSVRDRFAVPSTTQSNVSLTSRIQHEVGHTLGHPGGANHAPRGVMQTNVSALPRCSGYDARRFGRIARNYINNHPNGTVNLIVIR